MLVVHPHFHPRRTGVTSHVELIVPELAKTVEARAIGKMLSPSVPRITWRELFRRAMKENVIWHAHRNNELIVGILLQVLGLPLKLAFTRHDSKPPGRFTRFLFRFVDVLITLNAVVSAMVGRPSKVIGHGVDTTLFAPSNEPPSKRIGVIGRVRLEKGQGDFVEAIAPLLLASPEWTPVLVGLVKSEDAEWSQGLVRQTGSRLELAGEQSAIHEWYRRFSILVQPSHREAFSMVIVEAMASGCCVIATRVGAAESVIEDGVTGFLYAPEDVEGLRSILQKLINDPETVKRVGAAAREAVVARYGIATEAQQLAAVYREISP